MLGKRYGGFVVVLTRPHLKNTLKDETDEHVLEMEKSR